MSTSLWKTLSHTAQTSTNKAPYVNQNWSGIRIRISGLTRIRIRIRMSAWSLPKCWACGGKIMLASSSAQRLAYLQLMSVNSVVELWMRVNNACLSRYCLVRSTRYDSAFNQYSRGYEFTKGSFIATQLNSTRRRVELSCVAINGHLVVRRVTGDSQPQLGQW